MGLTGLKGRVFLVTGVSTKCEVFLRSLFVSNMSSASNFRHIVHNPFHEEEEDVVHLSKKSMLYLGDHQPHRVDLGRYNSGTKPIERIGIDFNAFKHFSPEQELLSM